MRVIVIRNLLFLFMGIGTLSSAAILENSCRLLFYPTAGVINKSGGSIQLTMAPNCDIETMRNSWPFAFSVLSEKNHGPSSTVLGIYRTPGLEQWDGLSCIARTRGWKRSGLTDLKCAVKAGQKVNMALTWGNEGLLLYVGGRLAGKTAFDRELVSIAPFMEIGRNAPFNVSRIAVSATQLSAEQLNFDPDKDFVADRECTLLANDLTNPEFMAAPAMGGMISLKPFALTAERIFRENDKFETGFVANNFGKTPRVVQLSLSITPVNGNAMRTTENITLEPGTVQRRINVKLPVLRPGLYTVDASAPEIEGSSFRISVLPVIEGPEGRLADYLGAANNREPELFKRIKLRWVRLWGKSEINWFELEPMRERWDFSMADTVVNAFRSHDVNVLGVLGYPPLWAGKAPPEGKAYEKYKFKYNEPGRWQPRNVEEWSAYVKKTVEHFRGRVNYYEIYNEIDFKPPGMAASFSGSTEDYFELLRSASDIIRNSDPANKVLISGFSMIPNVCDTAMPEELLKLGAADFIDIWNLHSYRALVNVPEMKRMIRKLKPDMPLWQTEQMWHILKDKRKIRYLTVAINLWFLELGFDKYMTFGWGEFLTDRHTMSPEDPLHAFAVNQQFLAGCEDYVGTHPDLPASDFDVRHILRRKDGGYLTVLGSDNGNYLITLDSPNAEIYDLMGHKIKYTNGGVQTNNSLLYLVTRTKPVIGKIRRLSGDQLLPNPGFEELGGDAMGGIEHCVPSDWVLRLKYDPEGKISINDKTPRSGKYAVNLKCSGKGRVYLFSYLKLSGSGKYRVSAHFRNVSGTAKPYISAFDTTAGSRYLVRKNFPTPPEDKYAEYVFDIDLDKVPGDKLAVIFGVDGGPGTISCDDVKMEKLSEPAFPPKQAEKVKLRGQVISGKLSAKDGREMDIAPLAALNGDRAYAGIPFLVGGECLIAASPDWKNLARNTTITVPPGQYREIYLLGCAMFAKNKKGETLATIELSYADGDKALLPLREQIELRDWYSAHGSVQDPPAAAKLTLADMSERELYAAKLKNPHPDRTLKEIRLTNNNTTGLVVIAGLTLRK